MGIRYLLLGVVLWLLVYAMRGSFKGRRDRINKKPPAHAMDMVACYHCGVHLPQAEAIYRDGQYYCCRQHSEFTQKGDE